MYKGSDEKRKLGRAAQPIIFRLWKLQISHNHPTKFSNGKEVVNVYWDLEWLFSKVPNHLSIPIGRYPLLQRLLKTNKPHIFVPSHKP